MLYMNLREPSDAGFPNRDDVPARILTDITECSQAEYTARCCALFAAIFQTLQLELVALLPRVTRAHTRDDADSLESQDLPVAPLPLTQTQRNELNEAIREKVRHTASSITGSANPPDELLVSIVEKTILGASRLLKRENIKDPLDVDTATEHTLQQYPKLRDMIHTVCQTSSFHELANLSEYLCNLIPYPDSSR